MPSFFKRTLPLIVWFFLPTSLVTADYLYEYDVKTFDFVNLADDERIDGAYNNDFSLSIRIYLDNPLPPNLESENITSSINRFTLTDGRQTLDSQLMSFDTNIFRITTDESGNIVNWGINVFVGGHTPPFMIGEVRREINSARREFDGDDSASILECFSINASGDQCTDIASDEAAGFGIFGKWNGPTLIQDTPSKSIPTTPNGLSIWFAILLFIIAAAKLGRQLV